MRNGFDDVSVILPCALTNHDGDVEMELAAGNLGDHRIRGKRSIPTGMREYYGEGRRRLIVVKTRTLDSVAARELKGTAERIGLAWVDIQGQEGAFLEGARQTLDRHRFPVMMELWPYGLRRSGMTRDRFCALVREHFSEIVLLGDGGPDEQHDAADLDVLFDRFPYPSHGNVLLVP